MSYAYRFSQECNGKGFDYGDLEEQIGFLFDHYYVALDMYRSIIKQMNEIDEKRLDAHQQLQKLRADEERWKKQGANPKDFDADEHQRRKDVLVELREMEYDLYYNDQLMDHNKLTNFIMTHMGLFKRLEVLDRKCRSHLGPLAEKGVKIALWPLVKMMNITANDTESLRAESFLRRSITQINTIPNMIKERIVI